jgi:hypothetical protein
MQLFMIRNNKRSLHGAVIKKILNNNRGRIV